jgi:hypothetical protein
MANGHRMEKHRWISGQAGNGVEDDREIGMGSLERAGWMYGDLGSSASQTLRKKMHDFLMQQ